MNIKEKAISFLKLAGFGKVEKAFDNYTAADFIHHNQYFRGTREALMEAMKEAHQQSPNRAVDVKYCYSEGNSVITHSHVIKKDMEIAVVHIFRFENDKIAELWDLGQVIEKDSPNELGLF